MSTGRFLLLLDALQQVADVAVNHAQRAQLLREAHVAYHHAVAAREDHAAFLLALEERLQGKNEHSRRLLRMTVQLVLRDQVAFGDACLSILDERGKG